MEETALNNNNNNNMSRKEKRKAIKKMKRKQMRKEMAERVLEEEEALLQDPEEQRRLQLMEQEEAERMERDRREFEERERAYMEEQEKKQQQQQQLLQQSESNHIDVLFNQNQQQEKDEEEEEEEEEVIPEIIWQGNEIIFKKKKLKLQDADTGPSSNPLPPESLTNSSTQPILDNVAQQVPNFGTEQDKAHCPFHLKTGVCRFGQRCSRVHFYPDKSFTLLLKNMYNGPGLAWEQDEGLEYTDEEIERCYEEFYEDVHTEFLKFGEIVNFKVCKNGSFHLRGNVYVQYKLLDSALLAHNSVNGRYFAGKQVSCKFVNLTRWKVAICGEYMKSGFKTCSHGTACNFIHCFRNPGGDYEWADSDKPPPKYWVKKMAALFGYSDDHENFREQENLSVLKNSFKISKTDSDRYHSRRSRSREMDQLNSNRSGRRRHEDERKQITPDEEHNAKIKGNYKRRRRTLDTDSDREWLEKEENREKHRKYARKSSFDRNKDDNSKSYKEESNMVWATITTGTEKQHGREDRNSRKCNRTRIYEAGSDGDRDIKRHRISNRKSSGHQSRDNSNVTSEAESDKDLFDRGDMERQHDFSRKSLRDRRSGLQDGYKYHENENDEVDGGLSRRESKRRSHHHKRKCSKHQETLDSVNEDTRNECQESIGE